MRQPLQISLSVLMVLTALELSQPSPVYSVHLSIPCGPSHLEWVSNQRNNPPTPSTPGGSRWWTDPVQSFNPELPADSDCISPGN